MIASILRKDGLRTTFILRLHLGRLTTLVSGFQKHFQVFINESLFHIDDDHAVAVLASALNHTSDAEFFGARSMSAYKTIFNADTGFMEARNASGAWAGEDQGWTEGDMWAYTFDVMQDVPGLIALKGGNASFVQFLDEHFDGGHNDQTNEVSRPKQAR